MNSEKKELLCSECRERVSYHICKRPAKTLIKDLEIKYEEYYGICDKCNKEIYVPGLDDRNEVAIEEAYQEKRELSQMVDALEQHYIAAGFENIKASLKDMPVDNVKTMYYKLFPEKLCEEVNYTYNYYPEYDEWVLEMRNANNNIICLGAHCVSPNEAEDLLIEIEDDPSLFF